MQEAAVVVEHALRGDDADVAGPVELGADLAELRRHVFVVVDELLAAEGTARRPSRNDQLPAARAERRRVGGVDLAERRDLALLDEADGLQHQLRRRAVGRADLVVGAPLGRGPFLVQRLVVDALRSGQPAHGRRRDGYGPKLQEGSHCFPPLRA